MAEEDLNTLGFSDDIKVVPGTGADGTGQSECFLRSAVSLRSAAVHGGLLHWPARVMHEHS